MYVRLSIAIVLLALSLSSCRKIFGPSARDLEYVTSERSLSDFSEISAAGSWDVTLIKSAESKVVLKVERRMSDRITTDISENRLNLGTQCCKSPKKTMYATIYTDNLQFVEITGSGSINSGDSWESSRFEAIVTGSGYASLNVSSDFNYVSISGSGDMTLSGVAKKQEIKISGSGKYRGYNLITDETYVDISGSGLAEVAVNQSLDADISGSGTVYYIGSPSSVNTRVTGSGKVVKK